MSERDTTRTRSADDVTGGQEAYVEAIRRAEAAAAAAETETPSPLPVDAVPVQASDQPLPEAEPAPAETPAEPEAETAAAVEVVDVDPLVEEYLAKYGGDAAAALKAAAHQQDLIGRQGAEVGELRAVVDELSAQVEAAKPQLAPVAITQELIDTNPAQATIMAYDQAKKATTPEDKQQLEQTLVVAFDAWKDDDPFTAGTWLARKELEQERDALRGEIAVVKKEVATLSKPQQEAAEREQWGDAFKLVSEKYPDFVQNAARILEEVAPNYPAILGTLASGDAKAKAEILTALYSIDRAGNPEQVAAQLKEAAAEASAEAEANRNGATVVTQATAGVGATVELTAEQEEQERYKERFGRGISLERGLTGRPEARGDEIVVGGKKYKPS